jgi:hypothetical protein
VKKPMRRRSRITRRRMATWTTLFSGYHHTVTEQRIERWLGQFKPDDRDLAARILDCVEFVTHEQMTGAFRSMLACITGWHIDESKRQGKWRFVAYSASAGESGDYMLHTFRLANRLNGRRFNELFIHRRDLICQDIGPQDTVIFVDDFAGTGDQVCANWPEMQELLPQNPTIYLLLVAASTRARAKIADQTMLEVVPHIELTERDNVFSPRCSHFSPAERRALLIYGKRADKRSPMGYGGCGMVIVFAHNCPNNSIPILHACNRKWEGLFRRFDP